MPHLSPYPNQRDLIFPCSLLLRTQPVTSNILTSEMSCGPGDRRMDVPNLYNRVPLLQLPDLIPGAFLWAALRTSEHPVYK